MLESRSERYRLERKLGSGGFGDVWLAKDMLLDRLVAVKRPTAAGGVGRREQFLNEARMLARLNHPNITQIHDAGFEQSENRFYLVMEYVAGENLDEVLARGPLSLEVILIIARGILDALAYAHGRDVVHRDLKPSNVMVGEGVKLTDFGFAELKAILQRGTGWLVGTPAYIAPEQIRGRAVDGRADLYSLGVMLYEMTTGGRLPFDCTNEGEMLEAHLHVAPAPLSALIPSVSPALEQVVMRLLAKEPEARYPSAETVIDALSSIHIDPKGNSKTALSMPLVEQDTEKVQALSLSGTSPVPLKGERRVITAMSADMKGSTALAGQIDVEDWVEIMNRMFQILMSEIYRFGGEVDQFRGDEVVAYFGATTVHEDDPERAVLAALAMQEAVKRHAAELAEQDGIELLLRVGVNTGEVIVGSVGDSRRHSEDTAMGRAIALAARMQVTAEPGTVLVSENTYRLIRPLFEWKPLGEVEVKGVSQPVTVYRPLVHKGLLGKGRGIVGLESPLVGRDAEVCALQEAIERLQSGIGGIVTLVGEAGLGKSRLVTECRGAATHQSWTHAAAPLRWIEGRCLSYGTTTAYQLWLSWLRALLGVSLDDRPAAILNALWEQVTTLCPDDVDDVFPYLGWMMSLPLEQEVEARLLGLGAQRLKVCTFRAMETLLESAARPHPLVVVCEDLHWADPTSIDLLEQLLALTDCAPLLFVCVLRPETERPCWRIKDAAVRLYRHRYIDLWLAPLSEAESSELVGNLLRIEDLAPRLKEHILSHGEGNPFYVEEILRSLIDGGVVVHDEATGQWQAMENLDEIAIPDTLHGVLMARIDRLQTEAKRVLQLASVIGRVFLHRVLAEIVEDERELDAHLLALQRAQMIRERARVPEVEYIFKHQLTLEAAYNGLLRKERRVYHRQVAEALERLFADRIEERVGLLAHHWEHARQTERAVAYLRRAGERAARQYANTEAMDYYQRLLPLLPREELVPVMLKLGHVLELVGEWNEADARYREALALAQELGDGPSQARSQAALGELKRKQGQYADAAEWFERARAGFAQLDDQAGIGQVLQHAGTLAAQQGDYESARRLWGESLAIRQKLDDKAHISALYNNLGLVAHWEGDLDAAREFYEQSLEINHDLGDKWALAISLNNLGYLAIEQKDYEWARTRLRASLNLQREVGDRHYLADTLTNLGIVARDLGDYGEARDLLGEGLAINDELENRVGTAYVLEGIAGLAVLLGRARQALRLSGASARLREEIGAPLPPAEQSRLEGLLRPAQEALDEVESAAAVAEGRAWSLEQAIEEALRLE